MDEEYLVWSNEHKSWWRPNFRGYATDITFAGIYNRDDALDIVRNATKEFNWKGQDRYNPIPNELPVRLVDLPDDVKSLLGKL